MMSRVLPYPLLTVSLIFFWMTINSFSPGHLLLGTGVALVASWAMASLRPAKPRIRNWHRLVQAHPDRALRYRQVQSLGREDHPVQAREGPQIRLPGRAARYSRPYGACGSGDDPDFDAGSAWLEYNSSQGTLLLHVLDDVDEAAWISLIKNRYEKLLMEIFE